MVDFLRAQKMWSYCYHQMMVTQEGEIEEATTSPSHLPDKSVCASLWLRLEIKALLRYRCLCC